MLREYFKTQLDYGTLKFFKLFRWFRFKKCLEGLALFYPDPVVTVGPDYKFDLVRLNSITSIELARKIIT
jgi:hypothetical protein